MKPSVLRQHDLLQLSYDLPHQIFAAKVYPLRSLNGSTIILYGHEQGLRILWHGGKPFRPPKPSEQKAKINGTRTSDPMVIDLDDEEPPAVPQPMVPSAEFEDKEEEVDAKHPYHKILRHIDLPFGASVMHLAIPTAITNVGQPSPDSCPSLFADHIVAVAACSDLSIHLIAVPLGPPSPDINNLADLKVQNLRILGPGSHQDLMSSISITHTAENLEVESPEEESKSRSQSRTGLTSTIPAKGGPGKEWSLLIASISCAGSGLLLIHQIPIDKNGELSTSPDNLFPIQRQYLRCSLSKSRVAFSSSSYPAARHSSLIIAIPDASCVKVYQVFHTSSHARGRRGSAATIDSTSSSSRSTRGTNALSGKFLVTLYPGFLSSTDTDLTPRRKRVLDASWILGGRAILVLMEGGEWGVWDLEAAGPSSDTTVQNLVKGQSNVSGVQGGSLSKFAIRGSLVPAPDSVSKAPTGPPQNPKSGDLAPMTPHTRKVRSDGLFQGATTTSATPSVQSGETQGSIAVTEQPSNTASSVKLPDESVILSYHGSNTYIPSILAFWRSESTGRGSFDSSSFIRPSLLPSLRLGGQQQQCIAQFSRSTKAISTGLFSGRRQSPDILVSTDSRLIFLVSPLSAPSDSTSVNPGLPMRPLNPASTSADLLLLTQGQLDVDGMDRLLDDMANGNGGSKALSTSIFAKSVGFNLDDDDEDVEMGMGTPTPKRPTRPLPRPRMTSMAKRRVFS